MERTNHRGASPFFVWITGGLAGCAAKTVTAPFARLSVLAQTSLNPSLECNVVKCARSVVSREGLWGLWRGNACACLHRFPQSGINFFVYDTCRSRYAMGCFASGAVGGMLSLAVCYPLDLVRTRLMAERYHTACSISIRQCLRSIIRDGGLRGIYRGLGSTLLLNVPSFAIAFGTYGHLKDVAVSYGLSTKSAGVIIFSGALSGAASATLPYPIDVVRRNIQLGGVNSNRPARSMQQEAHSIWRRCGIAGFYHGLMPELVKTSVSAAVTFFVLEALMT